jgi:hypothetical protein
MIKMRILLIGLVTALFLLTAVPAMATSVECDDCSMQVVVKNNTDKKKLVAIYDLKCMPVKSAQSATLQPGESFTGRMEYDKDAARCQELGALEHNNGYFSIDVQDTTGWGGGTSKWEVKIEAEGNGERIWFGTLVEKGISGDLDCKADGSNKLMCGIN